MYGLKSKQWYRYAAHYLGYAEQRASNQEGHGDEMIMAVLSWKLGQKERMDNAVTEHEHIAMRYVQCTIHFSH
jgi:hypothetical protein